MSRLKQNVVAGILGRGWSIAVALVVLPIYVRLLGTEAFGLVAFFTGLVALLQVLEFGLGATINRELARFAVDATPSGNAHSLARTLELLYWMVAAIIMLSLVGLAGVIARHWLNFQELSVDTVASALMAMGIAVGLLWPSNFYNNGLLGLERQALQSAANVAAASLRAVGAVAVLLGSGGSVVAFFLWQIAASTIQTALLAWLFWRAMPPPAAAQPRFSRAELMRVMPFTAGVGLTTLVTFALSQLDKVVLSRLLSLTAFGFYNVANQVNLASRALPGALHSALFPRFSALLVGDNDAQLRRLYHQASQLVSAVTFPAALTGACFAHDILRIWTGNAEIAAAGAPIMSVLLLGSAFNSSMGVPYDMTVAAGWPQFGLYQNIVSAIVLVPVMIALSIAHGGLGAAIAWLLLNLGCLAISMPLIHRRLLKGELLRWYFGDVLNAFAVCAAIAATCRWLLSSAASEVLISCYIVAVWLICSAACLLLLGELRSIARERLAGFLHRSANG
jgi:O-antigen/teichoic acid export membrane protein